MIKTKEIKSKNSYIELSSPELLWLGESGQPYRGTLYIQFISNKLSFDMLSLKKYITSLRQETILLEDIANKILNDLSILENDTLGVTVKTTPRGGISSTIKAGKEYQNPEAKSIYFGIK